METKWTIYKEVHKSTWITYHSIIWRKSPSIRTTEKPKKHIRIKQNGDGLTTPWWWGEWMRIGGINGVFMWSQAAIRDRLAQSHVHPSLLGHALGMWLQHRGRFSPFHLSISLHGSACFDARNLEPPFSWQSYDIFWPNPGHANTFRPVIT